MREIALSALDPRLQQMGANVSRAIEQGHCEYAVAACAEILASEPGCVEIRRLQRTAQLRRFREEARFLHRAVRGLSAVPFVFSVSRKNPGQCFRAAERRLAADPTDVAALRLLADAARRLELPETAIFAREAIRALRPAEVKDAVALGDALLAAGRAPEARRLAETFVRDWPENLPAREFLHRASIAETMAGANWNNAPAAQPTRPA